MANVNDAVNWVGYTYLMVRMRKNPFQYGMLPTCLCAAPADLLILPTGMGWDEVKNDPQLYAKRRQLITAAASQLAEARMIAFERATGNLFITDLGRIAAKYYVRHKSVEIFIQQFRPKMSEADVLGMLSESTEASLSIFCARYGGLIGMFEVRPNSSS